MKFRLVAPDGKTKVHEGVMPRVKAVDVVNWGQRAFLLSKLEAEVATYREAQSFTIGGFR